MPCTSPRITGLAEEIRLEQRRKKSYILKIWDICTSFTRSSRVSSARPSVQREGHGVVIKKVTIFQATTL
jgi:hypothetical protein